MPYSKIDKSSNEDFVYLKRCIAIIQEKLDWGNSEEWTNNNYERLFDLILAKTNTSISTSTLIRLFRKHNDLKEYYNPQLATKDALAQFLEYKNWRDFKVKNSLTPEEAKHEIVDNDTIGKNPVLPHPSSKQRLLMLVSMAILVLSMAAYYFYYVSKPPFTFAPTATSGFEKQTIGFNYDISRIKSQNVIIDLDYISYPLPKDKNYFNNFFEIPNFYHVKLIADGKVLAMDGIHIKNKEWGSVLGFHNNFFLLDQKMVLLTGGNLSLIPAMKDSITAMNIGNHWCDFMLIKDFNVDGDNFSLETTLKNKKEDGGLYCFDTEITIVGENLNSRVQLINPGCANFITFNVSDIILDGNYTDLSTFETDLSEWRNLKIKVSNKVAHIFIDKKEVYSVTYTQPLGKIKGLRFKFKGVGSVDYVKLFSNDKPEPVYSNTFD